MREGGMGISQWSNGLGNMQYRMAFWVSGVIWACEPEGKTALMARRLQSKDEMGYDGYQ